MSFNAPKFGTHEHVDDYFLAKKMSVDFKVSGFKRRGKKFEPELRVVAESGTGQLITVYIDDGLDDVFEMVNFKKMSDKRIGLLFHTLPDQFRLQRRSVQRFVDREISSEGVAGETATRREWNDRKEQTFHMHPDDFQTWRENIMAAVDGPGAFLPTGEWVKKEPDIATGRRSEASISRSAPEIIEFYRSIGKPVEVILPKFGYHYTAFVFENVTGKKVAIVAAGEDGNADYIFDASTAEWIDHASKTKLEILTDPDPKKLFFGRIIHTEGWQEKARSILEV